jgi:diguanylate cyclase (GGDEF)-like protein
MTASDSSVSRDLLHGTVHGVGLAAAIWTIPDPVLLKPACLVLVGVTGLAGLVRIPFVRGARVSLHYPVALAALILYGLGPAVLGAMLAALLAGLVDDRRARPHRLRRTAFEAGRAAVTVSFAGVAYFIFGGVAGGGLSFELFQPLFAYTIAYALVDVVLSLLEILAAGIRPVRNPWLATRWVVWVLGSIAAPLVILIYQDPVGRAALMTAPLFFVAYLLGRVRTAEAARRPVRRRRQAEVYAAIARALARARVGADTAASAHLERVQQLCLAVGQRMELSASEMEALGVAALLHDVGLITLPEATGDRGGDNGRPLRVHPRLGTEILGAIDFPFPAREFVEHLYERWDGHGHPRRLRGDAIPVGSRILAAVDYFDTSSRTGGLESEASNRRARSDLRGESGRRFDPLVVDLLLDAVERQNQIRSSVVGPPRDDEPPEDAERGDVPLERADQELQSLYDVERTLALGLELDQRLILLATRLAVLIPYEALVVSTFDRARQRLVPRFSHGPAAATIERRLRPGLSATCDVAPPLPGGATLVAPLVADGMHEGEIVLHGDVGRGFTVRERRLLILVAGHVAAALRRGASELSSRQRSLTDPVTGLPNGRFLRLETAHRLARTNESFGLLVLQIRGLDCIGERHGSAAADRLMGVVARHLAAACQRGETLVRFGSDQFIVLTPSHEPGELVSRWTLLSRRAESEPWAAAPGSDQRLRFAGAHAIHPDDGENLNALLAELGQRLPPPERERTIVPFRAAGNAG